MIPSHGMPGHLVRRVHQIATQVFLMRAQEAGFDLTPVQFAALDALRHAPGIDQARLAEAIAKDRATIGAVVDRLEQKGLVARAENKQDRRARVLKLTAKGERALQALFPVVEGVQKEILGGLTAAEGKLLVQLLDKVVATAANVSGESDADGAAAARAGRARGSR